MNKYIESLTKFTPLLNKLSLICRIKYENFCSSVIFRTKDKLWSKLLNSLSTQKPTLNFPLSQLNLVNNLSDTNLTTTQQEALSMGFGFKVPPRKIVREPVEAEFENMMKQLTDITPTSDENYVWFKSKMVDLAHHFLSTPMTTNCYLTKEHIKSLSELKSNQNIVILKPDKGSGVIIMNKAEYIDKVNIILQDRSKFLV
ncbi:MAG: hypothetical protein ACRCTW_09160, partial [Lactococcus garvieae]